MDFDTRPTKDRLAALAGKLDVLRGHLDVDGALRRVREIDELAAQPAFWNDRDKAQLLLKEQAQKRSTGEGWHKQRRALDDAQVLLELAEEAGDEATAKEAEQASLAIEKAVEQMELARMLSGVNDRQNALVSINAGAGGTDAQDWAEMLLRMYLRWCERNGYKTEVLDHQPGEEAGLKSATFTVEGEWAFGYLRSENGVHRLVRISPFDASARRQTAFAAVFVYPDLDESIDIQIRDEDLEIQTFRSGGAGGQHVNKTESAVRIIHRPSGIVVGCQSERSQHKNKSSAMKMLRAKLYEKEEQEKAAQMGDVHAQKKAIEWGSQIRSYVLAPYRLVTDHRTELKIGNVDAVLDGELNELIHAYLIRGKDEAMVAGKKAAAASDPDTV
ncbi:MAG TPA: peptide chain release factor 2 [Polyangia bacterium]